MKKATIILFSLLCHLVTSASNYPISGTVVNENNQPLEFTNISIMVDSIYLTGCTTDERGFFKIEVPKVANGVNISCVGYYSKRIKINDSTTDIGKIQLTTEATVLAEVVVKAPLIRREADRIILNIAANPLTVGKNAKDILRTSPGVWATDNALSIYGQTGTAVYIDDRKVNLSDSQLISYLQTLQATAISRIEIIPRAGAEYSADSSGGIIKIYLKKNRQDGVIGSIGTSFTMGPKKMWINPNFNLSYHRGNLTLNLVGNLNGTPSDRSTTQELSDNILSNSTITGTRDNKQKSIQGNVLVGAFYDIDSRNSVGLELEYLPQRINNEIQSTSLLKSPTEILTTNGQYRSNDNNDNINVRLNYVNTLDTLGSTLKFISNYNHQNSDVREDNTMSWIETAMDSIFKTNYLSRYNTLTTEFMLNKIFSEKYRFNIGAKYTYNNVLNISEHRFMNNIVWVDNPKYDYNMTYKENILGVYATANAKFGRWSLKAGVRGEYFSTSGLSNSTSYFDVFPNANASFRLTDKGDYSVSLGYYRNIRRPSFWSLSPIVLQVSDYSYNVGNPNLNPSYSNSISLDFILANKVTLATGFSSANNAIRQMFTVNPEFPERMYLTWDNDGVDNNFFIHGDGSVKLTKWWTLYASITYVLNSQKLKLATAYEHYSYVQLVGNTTFNLPLGIDFTIDCYYQSKVHIGNITVYPTLNINPSIRKNLGQKWNLSLGLENTLQHTSKIRAESSGYNRNIITKNYMAVHLSATYNFSTGKKFRKPRIESNIDYSRLIKE